MFDTGIETLRKYIPPHGGHTKNSLIRQEIQNYEAMGDLSDVSKEMVSLEGQLNLQARISRNPFEQPE